MQQQSLLKENCCPRVDYDNYDNDINFISQTLAKQMQPMEQQQQCAKTTSTLITTKDSRSHKIDKGRTVFLLLSNHIEC